MDILLAVICAFICGNYYRRLTHYLGELINNQKDPCRRISFLSWEEKRIVWVYGGFGISLILWFLIYQFVKYVVEHL